MTFATAAETIGEAGTLDRESLLGALEGISLHEARFTERFYEIFFERRPDTLPLFGPHAIAEREEMIRETLRSLHALCEQESWLEGNLVALGRSHWEYGVCTDMYDSYVEVLIDCARETVGDEIDETGLLALRLGILEVAHQMSAAGEDEERRRSQRGG
jgi:hemoglobin-like flavoprotein